METIGVSEQVKAVLEQEKERNGHTSYDSVIRELLMDRFHTDALVVDLRARMDIEGDECTDVFEEYPRQYLRFAAQKDDPLEGEQNAEDD